MNKAIIGFGLFGLLLVSVAGGKSSPDTSTSLSKAEPEQAKLKLNTFNCERNHGFATIQGTVKNVSDQPIDSLMVVGSYLQGDKFIKAATAMVEYQPLLPGQTSPFKAITSDNPAMTSCNVSFKTMFGGEIAAKR